MENREADPPGEAIQMDGMAGRAGSRCQGFVDESSISAQPATRRGCVAANARNHNMKNTQVAVENERVFRRWDYPLFILLTCINLSAIFYFFSYWFFVDELRHHPVTYSVLTLTLLAPLASYQLGWFILPRMRRPKPVTARSGWKVGVATTFVPGAEPLEMLDETVRALIALDYPHDTWVLDEGEDDRVKALCRELGAKYFSRKTMPQYQSEGGTFQSRSKHGNYNAWLYEIGFDRYEIITSFDPDHVPGPAFLSKVLGYFEDPKVGYVQAAQAYYNQKASFIARGAAEETYAYYSSLQMTAYAMGYPIVTGCHNTHRVTALKTLGGFAAHDADDLLITQLYRASGWEGIYVPQILARGLTPVDWRGYLIQQRRWARSVLDIKLRLYPRLSRNFSRKTRVIGFLHGLNYLQDGMMTPVGLSLLVFILVTGKTQLLSYRIGSKLAILYAVLQLCDFYRQRFYLDRRSEWGWHWRAGVLQFAKWPYFVLALYEVLFGRRVPYAITPKVKTMSRGALLLWPHMFVAFVLCAAWVIGTASAQSISLPVHVWTALLMAGSLAVVLTEFIDFPNPYDKKLLTYKKDSSTVSPRGIRV
ncbi:MAG: glycosyltransferase, partial [Candidatus Binatia bacterium]|nr:glycosyltransferase [Candidatus Binatia bacterium]